MRLADSNVWLALALSKHEFHAAARTWLAGQGPGEAVFCRSKSAAMEVTGEVGG